MKTRILFLACLACLLAVTACGRRDWAAKIDGQTISMKDFETRYQMYMEAIRQQPGYRPLTPQETTLVKRELLKTMIGENLIYRELRKEKFERNPEIKQLFQQVLIQKYLEQKIVGGLSITPQEVDAFYNENKQHFRGMDPEMAQQRIQYQLTLKKFESATGEIVDRLYAKSKVEQNENIFLAGHEPVFSTNR